MQKIITVAINTKTLMDPGNEEANIAELESVNAFLVNGWEVQEWEVLRTDEATGMMLLWVVLNDDLYIDEDDDDDLDINDL